ncbi:hypothetical protein [Streptomyces liangshanensis]|uniref:Uncharacterized protein n=1 Tax=Streptomyces liangshanensis TaxID=2717324 RepID=A0A6G9GZ91_9ACTN|nr:hypothetical protein [Streptomyces liangshanensis]QIQ03603.1 hypothetical protein HA039_15830 [Streptomyces liangshanensis]
MTTNEGTSRSMTRPKEVRTAFLLLLTAIAVDAVLWVWDTLLLSPSGLDEMREEMGDSEAIRQVAMSAGFLVLTSGCFLFLVLMMRQGRNWARGLVTASAALVTLFLINSMNASEFHKETTTDLVYDLFISVSPVALIAGAVVLMFQPAANKYFSPADSRMRGLRD